MNRGRYASIARIFFFLLLVLPASFSGELRAQPEDSSGPEGAISSEGPYFALVIDDFGFSRKMTTGFAALKLPVTWAILPFERHSVFAAEEAKEAEIPYIIHMPMGALKDSAWTENATGNVVDTGMSPGAVADVLLQAVETLPDAVGLNNHRGSRATADVALMDSFMEILSGFSLFFLDSRTNAFSAAYSKAVEKGVPALYSSVFLDHQADEAFMETQFLRALDIAKRRGWVVVIAHARSETLQYLQKLEGALPEGCIFVTLPELLRLLRIR